MSAARIRAPDARDSKSVVPTRQKPLADVTDPLQAEHAEGGGVLLIVDVVELLQMPVEDRVQLIATPGDVASLAGSRGRSSGRFHTLHDGRKVRRASLCRLGAP